jgi:hypothetical protein
VSRRVITVGPRPSRLRRGGARVRADRRWVLLQAHLTCTGHRGLPPPWLPAIPSIRPPPPHQAHSCSEGGRVVTNVHARRCRCRVRGRIDAVTAQPCAPVALEWQPFSGEGACMPATLPSAVDACEPSAAPPRPARLLVVRTWGSARLRRASGRSPAAAPPWPLALATTVVGGPPWTGVQPRLALARSLLPYPRGTACATELIGAATAGDPGD